MRRQAIQWQVRIGFHHFQMQFLFSLQELIQTSTILLSLPELASIVAVKFELENQSTEKGLKKLSGHLNILPIPYNRFEYLSSVNKIEENIWQNNIGTRLTSPLMCRLFITIRAVPGNGLATLATNKMLMSLVSQSKPNRITRYQNTHKSHLVKISKKIYGFKHHKLIQQETRPDHQRLTNASLEGPSKVELNLEKTPAVLLYPA